MKRLLTSILSGLVLVVVVIFFAMGIRNALLVSLAIPFSMLWLRERPTRWTLAGTLLATAGIALVAPGPNLADSRPGQTQRAGNYTAENRFRKRFSRVFLLERPMAAIAPTGRSCSQKEKAPPDGRGFFVSGGADGTRTRDPRRDRPVF